MNRYLLLPAGAIFLTLCTILLSSFTQLSLRTSLFIIFLFTLVGMLLVSAGYAYALFEARRERSLP